MTSRSRTTTAIRFPPELHEQLRVAAGERDLSINYLVVRAVQDFLPRLIPADELRLTRDEGRP
jgi:predicted HicB family RNase H-like nuclease